MLNVYRVLYLGTHVVGCSIECSAKVTWGYGRNCLTKVGKGFDPCGCLCCREYGSYSFGRSYCL